MLGTGSALGMSIFAVLTPAAKIAGSGILISIGVAAIPMAVFAIAYAFLVSAAPRSGASFQWPFEFIHPFAGYTIAWTRIAGQICQMTTQAVVLIHYLSAMINVPLKAGMFGLFSAIFAINYFGTGVAVRAQTLFTLCLIAVLAIYIVTGLPQVQTHRIMPLAGNGFWPILLVVPLMITLYMGIEASTEIGEEVHDAERNVPIAMAVSLLLIASVYFAVTFVTLGLIGPAKLGQSPAPLVDAARRAVGGLATPLVLAAATISLLKSLNASFLISPARCSAWEEPVSFPLPWVRWGGSTGSRASRI